MAIKGTYLPDPHTPLHIGGVRMTSNQSSEAITPDYGMLASTVAVTAAQAAAFNILRIPRPHITNKNQFKSFLSNPTYQEPDSPDGYGPLGTPIYGSIVLGDPDKEDNQYTDAQGNTMRYKTVELDCAIVTLDFNNQIIKTNIQGLNQTIKEYISSGDNDVTITGIYNSTPGVAPMDFIIAMSVLFSAPVAIPVQNYYLNANNIYFIVIMPGTTMGQAEGGYATQTFTIKAMSDVPMDQMLP
jgi:hypothetical protein